ncbi:hypothetical protein Pyrde_1138 [Pyrodictium delaneyi]|uniref:Uncharacterized protein n=1 Tax=Pyrodictium delaneyi TaxID=1273541 RepID=A0A0P0N2Q0_9CREN|nr:THUMP domain-containing protein [Pyrodictium delaneyi]ALL01186.1 hypothetical protein Pyrde_1138 [Pyrodictium delaneyi]OWJ55734.1 hypothetical protein Pdsh_02865 [Pyrodictium delaneyi]
MGAEEVPRYRLFNLIVAHEPGYYSMRRALREIESILGRARVFDAPRSLLLLKVSDPYDAVRRIAREVTEDSAILRAIPIDLEVPPYVDYVASTAKELLSAKADRSTRFAIRLEGRLYDRETGRLLHKRDAIEIIADGIELPVDLDNPDLLVLVKVVRVHRSLGYAAIMVAPPCAVYSRAHHSRGVCI